MNERDLDTQFDYAGISPTAAGLSAALASVITELHDYKRRIAQGVEDQFVPSATAAAQSMSRVSDWIDGRLVSACRAEQFAQAKIQNAIEAPLAAADTAVQIAHAKIARAEANLSKKRGKGITGPADATPRAPDQVPQSPGVRPELQATAPSGGPTPAARSFDPNTPFPPPPTPDELVNLVVPLAHDQGALPLMQMPAEVWHYDNPNLTWLSLERTPVTRVEITAFRVANDQITPAGLVFLNSGLNLDRGGVLGLLEGLGISQEAVLANTLEDAWAQAVELYGPSVPTITWDSYGLPHPDLVSGRLGPLNPALLANAPLNAQDQPGTPHGRVLGVQEGEIPNPFDLARRLAGNLPGLADVGQGAAQIAGIPGLRFPTIDELCNWFVRPWRWRGLDPIKCPPCASWETWAAYLSKLAHEEN